MRRFVEFEKKPFVTVQYKCSNVNSASGGGGMEEYIIFSPELRPKIYQNCTHYIYYYVFFSVATIMLLNDSSCSNRVLRIS